MYAYDVNGACPDEEPFLITVNITPPAPEAGNDTTYCIGSTMSPMYGVPSDPQGVISWYDSDQISLLSTGLNYTPYDNQNSTVYYVTETLNNCEGPASIVTITIQGCDITIPTAITPNSDLNNDSWEIVDLDLVYPVNVVQVYNRWGNLIFEHVSSPSTPYDQNRWDGTYDGSALPVGSYYYVIKANDADNTVFTGAVSIVLQ
jgi:gliding motility-associated-like protein